MEGADVGDADRGAGHGQDQRIDGIQRPAPRHGGPREQPRDGHAHPDADHHRESGVEEAVHDVLRRLHDHALVVLERVGHRQRGQRPALPHRGQRHPDVGDEGQQQEEAQEGDDQRLPRRREPAPLDLRVGQRRVVLDGHVVPGGQQEEDREQHHQRGDHDPHAEDAPVHELHDVEIGLGGQEVLHAQHERGGEVGERPDEDEQRPRHVARRGQRQGDPPELGPAACAHALRRFLERGVHLAESVHHVQRDHREEVERLHQHHPVEAVEEVDRPEHVEDVHQQHVHRARAPQDEGEAQHADERRRDDRDHGEVAEEVAPREVVAHQQEGDRDAQDRGADHRRHAQDHRVHQRAQVEAVGEELPEVRQGPPSRLVGDRVVEDAPQRVDQEQNQERPDQPNTHRRPQMPTHGSQWPPIERRLCRRNPFLGEARRGPPRPPSTQISSETARVTDGRKVRVTGRPTGSGSWCHGSRISALSTSPGPVCTS